MAGHGDIIVQRGNYTVEALVLRGGGCEVDVYYTGPRGGKRFVEMSLNEAGLDQAIEEHEMIAHDLRAARRHVKEGR